MRHNKKKYLYINNKYRRTIGILLSLVLFLLSYIISKKNGIFLFFLASGCFLFALTIYNPKKLDKLAKIWLELAILLNRIISPILFSTLFILLVPLFTIRMIKRKFRREFIANKRKTSMWEKISSKIDFNRPF